MANHVPMLGGTAGAGGYLVRDAFGPTLSDKIARISGAYSLVNKQRINTDVEKFPIYMGRPTVSTVGEGAAKPVTGAEFGELTLNVKKAAAIVMYSDELLADAAVDPQVLVNDDVAQAFAEYFDKNILGYDSSGPIVGAFDSELTATTQTVELGTTGDAMAIAISSAIDKVEQNGYDANGIVLARSAKVHFRNARQTVETAMPVYSQGYDREPDSLFGLPIAYSTNLWGPAGTAGADRVIGVVGDFSETYFAARQDLTRAVTNLATVDVSGTLHHLWQQNKTAVRWEARAGFVAHDLNHSFAAIINAS